MFEELGGLFGWLLIFAFVGTILNYCLKFVNKRISKKIAGSPFLKKVMKFLMTVFVRNHRYFGLATVLLLLAHFVAQFSKFGINITGAIAAVIMLVQVGLGIYANINKKPRKGAWFVLHRTIAVLLILGIALHLAVPEALSIAKGNKNDYKVSSSVDASKLKTFTKNELANYDGKRGNKAYVAYKGYVYDVSRVPEWKNGTHHGQKAGTDITKALARAPHGNDVLKDIKVVGKLK